MGNLLVSANKGILPTGVFHNISFHVVFFPISIPMSESPEPVTAAIETKTSGGVYIPPSRRQGGGGPTGARRPPHNVPPDIQNASAFPSLQASLQSQPTGKE